MIGLILSGFCVGTIVGAWSILSLLSLRPDLAERWRDKRHAAAVSRLQAACRGDRGRTRPPHTFEPDMR